MSDDVPADRCPLIVLFISEFINTGLFIFAGCMVYISGALETGPLLPSFAFGLAILGMFQITAHLTPAYMNPALSLGMFIMGKMDWKKLIVYWIAEYSGAVAGYGVLKLCSPKGDYKPCFLKLHDHLTITQGFFIEFIISVILMMSVAGASDDRLFADTETASLRIALVVTGLLFAAEPYTGGCMNPARSLPACLFFSDWTNHWLFQVAPFSGMIAGAIVYRYVFDYSHKYSLYSFLDDSG